MVSGAITDGNINGIKSPYAFWGFTTPNMLTFLGGIFIFVVTYIKGKRNRAEAYALIGRSGEHKKRRTTDR